jgi:signal transduction histidine kinase
MALMTEEIEVPALRRLLDVALALSAERRTEPAMRTILAAARDLVGARYAAIGVPDGDGGFGTFLTSGIDDKTWERIGAMPRTHGLLGALLQGTAPIRLADITADPRFVGYPAHHPWMRSFLGVPIVAGGEVVAELFLADKPGDFTDADARLLEMLAAHAALAVVNAQRHERSRELSIVEERTRIARDLHDSITQTLFSLTLVAESAATLAAGAEPRLREQLDTARELTRTALEEMRSLVETLRGEDTGRDSLAQALTARVELLRAVHDVPIELTIDGDLPRRPTALTREVLKIGQEALANALQHADASRITMFLGRIDASLVLTVIDDGVGFDLPETVRSTRRLGLVSMADRAKAIGAKFNVYSTPGSGTRVLLEVRL